jgi:hypothetical protein
MHYGCMTEELAKLIIDSATCVAAIGLTIATCVLVRVTRQHARHAEQLALAATRLADSLDRQGIAMTDASDLHALVNAVAADTGGTNHAALEELSTEIRGRRKARVSAVSSSPPTR